MNLPSSDFAVVDKLSNVISSYKARPGLGPLTAPAFPKDDANGLFLPAADEETMNGVVTSTEGGNQEARELPGMWRPHHFKRRARTLQFRPYPRG